MAKDSNSTIAKNTIVLCIRMVVVLFVSLYTSRVFLRVLGVEDFGINNVVCGFVALFGFLNTSLANGIQRFLNYEEKRRGDTGVCEVFNTSILIQAILAFVVFVLLETLGLWYVETKMVIPDNRYFAALWIYQFSVISAIIVIMQAPFTATVMAYERMNYFAFVGIVDIILKLLLALSLDSVKEDKLIFYGIALLIITVVDFILYYVYCRRNFKSVRFKRVYTRKMFFKMLAFSGWGSFGTFACVAREEGLNIVLNLFFGPIVNAARGIAYQVSAALQGFVTNISVAAKPQMVSSFAGGDSSRTIYLMYSMSKISFMVLLLMAVPLCVEIDYILHLWLGDVVPEHTASFVILIILSNFMNNLNAPLSNVIYATGDMKYYEITFSLINLAIIPISYYALYLGSAPETAFLIYFIMTIFVQVGCLIVLKKIVGINLIEYTKKLVIPLALCVVVVVPLPYIISLHIDAGVFRLVLTTALTAIIAIPSFYLIVMNKEERLFVRRIIMKVLRKI